jgi:hypothetical protein
MHKEAVHQLVLTKLTEAIQLVNEKANNLQGKVEAAQSAAAMAEVKAEVAKTIAVKASKKPRPLQSFLDKKKQKVFNIPLHMVKSESNCPDCGVDIFNGSSITPCICYGDVGKIFLKKTESGIKVRFSKGWELENIEMLLDVLKKRH